MTIKKLALIPARKGSKSIPGKNLIEIQDEPLVMRAVRVARESKVFDKVVVSTNDEKVISICEASNVEYILRPDSLSTDFSPMEPVVLHAIEELDWMKEEALCFLLQPTSPLRTIEHIKDSLKLYLKMRASSLISVSEIDNSFLKSFVLREDDSLKPVSDHRYPFARRQDLPLTYKSNGSIYIFSVQEFLKYKTFLIDKSISYLMTEEESLDIDTHEDLEKVKILLHEIN